MIATVERTSSSKPLYHRGDIHYRPTVNRIYAGARKE
jgi:hypothetical protein